MGYLDFHNWAPCRWELCTFEMAELILFRCLNSPSLSLLNSPSMSFLPLFLLSFYSISFFPPFSLETSAQAHGSLCSLIEFWWHWLVEWKKLFVPAKLEQVIFWDSSSTLKQ